jgi:hypothetical protein
MGFCQLIASPVAARALLHLQPEPFRHIKCYHGDTVGGSVSDDKCSLA